jgi:hypothetical protein
MKQPKKRAFGPRGGLLRQRGMIDISIGIENTHFQSVKQKVSLRISVKACGFKVKKSLTFIPLPRKQYLLLRHRHFKKLKDNFKRKRRGMMLWRFSYFGVGNCHRKFVIFSCREQIQKRYHSTLLRPAVPWLRGWEFCPFSPFFANFSTFTKISQVPSFQAHSPVKTVFHQNQKSPENRKTHQARTLTKTRRNFP